tara:strand:- start:1044 stop:1526 length:483 start_codon:yes stop_codon:yes gene_type:complete
MPNWCSNEVCITGDAKDIKKIEKLLKSKESIFDFNKIAPEPDWKNIPNEDGELPYLETDGQFIGFYKFKSTGKQDDRWYEWRLSNWGTKWGVGDVHYEHEEDVLRYDFDTAWSPPQGIYKKLNEMVADISEDIHISWFYREDGMQFAGYLNSEEYGGETE